MGIKEREDSFQAHSTTKPTHHSFVSIMAKTTHVDFTVCTEWMWYDGNYIPNKLVFASTYDSSETFVVSLTDESLNAFTYYDVIKNLNTWPLNTFQREEVQGKEYRVPLNEFEDFIVDEFYETKLKEPHGWDVTIGTDDMATFIYLEPLLHDKIKYLGKQINATEGAIRLATNQSRWQ
ncbi:hypothetical protein AVEN_64850-1 [Araneus ventricosus]|uniref:Uncharacterized protein n=1 Tax=Araneus ventricosus TaxID=182803 RepID=A0A4Y2GJX2_ARAVE|nr:hypothetical protein AVEN_64850-1 [Araneus ventricosus]